MGPFGIRIVGTGIVLLILSSCGGGGSAGPETPPGNDLSGNAGLGIIIGGVVTVQDAGGTRVATSITDNLGNYGPVSLPPDDPGPFVIEISPAGNGSSSYVCDFPAGCPDPANVAGKIAFGATVAYTTTLSAVAANASQVNTANINPLTTAIRERAQTLGGITTANMNQANAEMASELNRLFGVDLTTPISQIPNVDLVNATSNVTDPTVLHEGIVLSLINAGLTALVSTTDSNMDSLDKVVGSLVSVFAATGKFGISSQFGEAVNAGEMLFAAEQEIKQLAQDQGQVFDAITAMSPGIDLNAIAIDAATTRNGIAPVPPQISGTPPTSTLEDALFSFTPTTVDPDLDTLTYTITNKPSWATFDTATGTLSGTPTNSDVGTTQEIVISVSDPAATVSLPAFNLEVINVNDPPVGVPLVIGTAVENGTVTVDASGISDPDGLGTFSFQWQRNGIDISGATGTSYMAVNADVGLPLDVVVSYVDARGTAESVSSAKTAPVVNVNDAPTGAVLITGIIGGTAAWSKS